VTEVPKLLGVREVADALGVSEDWLYERAARSEIPSYKIGGMRKFRLDEVLAWLEQQREGPAVDAATVTPIRRTA
jgi:excisionase family DNA binding protein